jgi:8-oxo-dGTP diphosphatase
MDDTFPRIGSALIVFDDKGQILLGQRNKDPQRGMWVIPGGKILAFESIAEAGKREVLEETGLLVEFGGTLDAYEIINPPYEHRIVIYSWGRAVGGTLQPSSDLSSACFFPMKYTFGQPLSPLVRGVLLNLYPQLEKLSKQSVPK